ncbi:hypothetical protein AAVH_37564, partial [Aphelenchoides avenae]
AFSPFQAVFRNSVSYRQASDLDSTQGLVEARSEVDANNDEDGMTVAATNDTAILDDTMLDTSGLSAVSDVDRAKDQIKTSERDAFWYCHVCEKYVHRDVYKAHVHTSSLPHVCKHMAHGKKVIIKNAKALAYHVASACKYCGLVYASKAAMEKHSKKLHPFCGACKRVLLNADEHREHRKAHALQSELEKLVSEFSLESGEALPNNLVECLKSNAFDVMKNVLAK